MTLRVILQCPELFNVVAQCNDLLMSLQPNPYVARQRRDYTCTNFQAITPFTLQQAQCMPCYEDKLADSHYSPIQRYTAGLHPQFDLSIIWNEVHRPLDLMFDASL